MTTLYALVDHSEGRPPTVYYSPALRLVHREFAQRIFDELPLRGGFLSVNVTGFRRAIATHLEAEDEWGAYAHALAAYEFYWEGDDWSLEIAAEVIPLVPTVAEDDDDDAR